MKTILYKPTNEERRTAEEAFRALEGTTRSTKEMRKIRVSIGDSVSKATVPQSALAFLIEFLRQTSRGKTVRFIYGDSDLNTHQAAEVLNVPRSYLTKLLEEGKIPFTKIGEYRKIQLEDLLDYKEQKVQQRREYLKRLTEEAQKLDEEYSDKSKTIY